MLSKKVESDRFSKVLMKINSSQEKPEPNKPPSSQNSFLQDFSLRSDKSTKIGSQADTRSPQQIQPMDQSRAIKILLEDPEVLVARKVVRMRTEFVPTSNGMRFVVGLGDTLINLSWLHSVQELEPGKILLLYYDLRGLGERKAKLESLVLEGGRTQSSTLLQALNCLHVKYHDDEVEKLYHSLC